ncbi:MAG: transketolase [Bacilli bacterium]|nr:transketolase [Bacilli bacterium]
MNEERTINAIKALALAEISKAKSGHPGIVLGAAPILYTLYSKHMNVDVRNDKWINRDRFVLSAGHGSALLYAVLYMAGFDLSIKDLKSFRQLDSKTPGHPEFGITPGVDCSTGPLGQGMATAVGMAASQKYLSAKFNGLFDYNTYVLCGEGDLMEGVCYEACSLAGNLKLDNLIVLYDANNVTLDGSTSKSFSEDVLKRFEAFGWHTELVKDGNDTSIIDAAITKAKAVRGKPSFIKINTVIGKDSLLQGTNKVHGTPLTKEDVRQIKDKLKIDTDLFSNIGNLRKEMANFIRIRVSHAIKRWDSKYNAYLNSCDSDTKRFLLSLSEDKRYDVTRLFKDTIFEDDELRNINGMVMNTIANNYPAFLGGSADLSSSTKTYLNRFGDFAPESYAGKNLWFGVREHAMGAFVNGMALSGLRAFASTFLVFSDYLKPAIRMASLMNLPSVFVFTHDSVMVGQDGPTHQPVEELAMLRSIPNHYVYRPCDANEIIGSWQALLNNDKPSSVVLSRSKARNLDETDPLSVKKGAYVIRKEKKRLNGIIIATGSEVELAMDVAEKLSDKGLELRVVSMPCTRLFEEQPASYREETLPIGYKTFVIERASKFGWNKYVYNDKYIMGIDEFGYSGKTEDVLEKLKLDNESITKRIEKLLR